MIISLRGSGNVAKCCLNRGMAENFTLFSMSEVWES